MKTFLIGFILSLTICRNTTADVVTPDIYAICKVTLNNNKTVEGIILLAKGGWGKYIQNGFVFILEDSTIQLKLYDLSVKHLSLSNSCSKSQRKLFFVENMTTLNLPETNFRVDNTKKIITRKIVQTEEFKLSEKMVLYKTLALNFFLEFVSSDTIAINVSEISKIELFTNPPLGWLDVVTDAKEMLNNKIMADLREDEDAWPDLVRPVWYHEVIIDTEKMKYLLTHF